jgi:uncharacterized RDD family membrane protein YckC
MTARLVLTPEHVEVRLQPAGLGSRFLAISIDSLLVFAISMLMAQLLLSFLPAALGYVLWATATFVLTWGYHVYFETRHEGRSPGKRVMRLRVVDGRGLPLGLGQSFVRNVVRVLDSAPVLYGLGALASLLDPHRRRLGDLAADTLVVAEGRSQEPDATVMLSPEYNSLRTPRVLRLLRRRVGLEEREFLAALVRRTPELEERARYDLMEEAGEWFRQRLELRDLPLSGEQIVRGLAAVLLAGAAPGRPRRAAAHTRVPRR